MSSNRLLILRFSSIGDIVLTTAVVEFLQKKMPQYELHFMTLSDYAPILQGNPHLARIISVEKGASRASLRHLAMRIAEFNYDHYIDLHDSLRTKYLRWWLKDEHWVVCQKPRLRRSLLFYFHVNRYPKNHDILSEYFNLLNGHTGDSFQFNPTIYVNPQEKERARLLLEDRGVAGDFLAVVPGAAWQTKIWRVRGYRDVLMSVIRQKSLGVVLLGGQTDSVCDQIAGDLPDAVNLKGITDLRSSLAILSCARAALGSDTGLVHGAEAVGTPVVMINGPTSPEHGVRTRGDRSVQVSAGPWCQPCSKNGHRPCFRSEQICMTQVTPDAVLASLNTLIGDR